MCTLVWDGRLLVTVGREVEARGPRGSEAFSEAPVERDFEDSLD